jgi:uncharacterized protein
MSINNMKKYAYLLILFISILGSSLVYSSEALLTKGYNKALAGNYGEAYRILQPLASQGYIEAQFNLGMMFQNGGSGLQKNNASSAYWFNQAAIQGDQNSQFELAGIYYRGLGVKKDLKIAKYWAKLASQGSNPTIASRSREFLKNQMSWLEKQKLGVSTLLDIFTGN